MKNIIKTLVVCCVVVLGVMRSDAATATGQSGNCIVNTCKLSVTAEANPYGILLKWSFTEKGFTAQITRDDKWLPVKTLAASEAKYLDQSAEYGKMIKYTVEITGDGDFIGAGPSLKASIPATRGSGKAPVVSKLEFAPLWLIKEGPYNVRVTISDDYDINRYEGVTEIGFTINGTRKWFPYDKSGIYNLYPKFTIDKPGECKVKAQCKYKERTTQKIQPPKNGEGECEATAKVFFHKYGKNCNEHLWFKYWQQDKAIDHLSEFGKEVKYSSSTASVNEHGWHSCYFPDRYADGCPKAYEFEEHVIGNLRFPKGVLSKLRGYEFRGLGLTPIAAARDKENIKNNITVFGIKAAASTCSHELIHKKTRHNFFFDSVGEYRYVKIPDLSDAQVDFLKGTIDGEISDENKKFVREVLKALEKKAKIVDNDGNTELCDDVDHDGVLDRDERKWHSTIGNKTTAGKTDVEFVAYYNSSSNGAHPEKDFAFPGTKIAKTFEGYTATEWQGEILSQQRALSAFSSKALSKSMVSMRNELQNAPIDDLKYDESPMYEDIEMLPDISYKDITNDVTIVSISKGKGTDSSNGFYFSLSFDVKLHNTSGNDLGVLIGGCLMDENGNPIIGISKPATLSNGVDTVCTLTFPASYIYRSKCNGYFLKSFTVVSYEEDRELVHAYAMDAAESDRLYTYAEFVPDAGYINKKTLVSEKNGNNIEIAVDVEIVSNGVYELSATLYNTNCEYVTSARIEGLSILGEQKQTLVFPGNEIFLSKIDGPYEVFNVELRREGEPIDSGYHLHTTAAYSYRDFANGSETIFADAGSFRREADLVGADGFCDALNFSFAVTNLAPSEAEYVARIYLCGTNDELVCSSTRNVVLSNEVNDVAIAFSGVDIKKRDVEGPYYVSEVTIEDAESGEMVERFKPEQILIDRRLDEFGSPPVAMNGEVTLLEATDGNPFAVEIPVEAIRPGTVTVSAVLVTTNGTPVTYVETSRDFAAGETGSLTLRFSDDGIVKSGVRGPYYIKYIAVRSGYEGLDEVQIDDPDLGMLNRQFTLYVDCANEDDSGDGLTPTTAKATIRGALAVAQPGDLILVADGVYEPFACAIRDITIRSVNGPEKTIIDGEGQLQCAYFENLYWEEVYNEEEGYWDYVAHEITGGVIEGFTLQNGLANDGGGIYGGTARRCIIVGNRAEYWGGGAYRSTLDNCIVCGNSAGEYGGGVFVGKVYNCTIADNTAVSGCGGVYASSVFNSIVWGNKDGNGGAANYGDEEYEDYYNHDEETGENAILRTEFHASCTYPMPDEGEGNIDDDPLLVDAGHGDARLRSNSPCIDAGFVDHVSSLVDVFGAVRIQGVAPEMGAVENNFEDRICVSAMVRGVGSVAPASAFVEEGGAIVFTATETGREFLRFETNGVYATSDKTLVIHNVQEGLEVVAVFTPGALYVRKDGSDENDGLRWSSAKATIQGAIDDSAQGDVIYVGEGVFAPFDSNNRAITIRSVYGAERTVIDACGVGACAYMGGYMSAETNTCLMGFTLRNGYVLMHGAGASGGTLVDCRVENNKCHLMGGGLYRSVANRCVIAGNCVGWDPGIDLGDYSSSSIGGGGARGCTLENCLIVSNVVNCGSNGEAYGGGTWDCLLYSCTVADNFISVEDTGGDVWLFGGGVCGGKAYNTICWGNMIAGKESNADDIHDYDETMLWMDEDPLFAGAGQYTLLPESPCIDVGLDEYARGDKDIAGNARICGDGVDIGAYEYAEVHEKSYYTVRFDSNGGEGEMPSVDIAYGAVTNLPVNTFSCEGCLLEGWAETPDGNVVYRDADAVINLIEQGEIILYAKWRTAGIVFMEESLNVSEGRVAHISVFGGSPNSIVSVKLYLAYNTAAAADLDLKTATVADGDAAVSSKPPYQTNLKFPLTLSWEAGEIGEKVIKIPVKADTAVEDDELFTLQLADAQGMELGEGRVCTVTIRDPGYDDLAAKVAAGTATAAELKVWDKLQSAKAPYIRGVADSAESGKVSGSGLCAAGKKVTLKASANKGWVFVGWTTEQIPLGGDRLAVGAQEYLATTPTLVIDRSAKPAKDSATSTTLTGIDGDATFYANFISADEDKAAIAASVDGLALEPWVSKTEKHAFATNVWAGVYLEWPVAASALSATTVKVAGLPSGLKFAAKPVTGKVGSGKAAVVVTNVPANTIYGAPTAASKADKSGAVKPSEVKVTVTTAGKSSQTYQIDTTVVALPSWSQGSFVGGVRRAEDNAPYRGTVSLTVSAAGKVSGKAQGDGIAYTLAAPSYSAFAVVPGDDGPVSNFLADVTASWSYKEGGKTIKTNDVVRMTVRDNGIGGRASADDWFEAYTVNWKAERWKTLGPSFDKKEMAYAILSDGTFSENEEAVAAPLGKEVVGRVTLKFKANGTASVLGEFVLSYDETKKKYVTVKASGSATLVPVDEGHCVVFIYLTPKGLSPHSRCLSVPRPEE